MSREAGYLLVCAGVRRVGLPIAGVVEVIEPGRTYPVPAVEPAIRGVVTVHRQILPVVHLGALLDGGVCPAVPGGIGVIVALDRSPDGAHDGCRVCLEVEEADAVLREPGLPVPPGTSLPWAVAVVRYAGTLVPLLDLSALRSALANSPAARLSETQPV